MLGALLKAFTGRAGFLASVLALLIVVVIAASVILGLPKIEQKILSTSQSYLKSNLDDEVLAGLSAEGRDIYLSGEIKNPSKLKASLASLEGVRNAIVNTVRSKSGAVPAVSANEQEGGSAEKSDASVTTDAQATASSGMSEQGVESNNVAVEDEIAASPEQASNSIPESIVDESTEAETPNETENETEAKELASLGQSSLSLRYDGNKLSLSGHVADAQLAQLIKEDVKRVAPQGSIVDAQVEANGAPSPLNWVDEFLDIVAGLPNDAQGVIEGSDQSGVTIQPDDIQSLRVEEPLVDDQKSENNDEELDSANVEAESAETSLGEQNKVSEAASKEDSIQEQLTEQTSGSENEPATISSTNADSPEVVTETKTEDPQALRQQGVSMTVDPVQYILDVNKRLALASPFEAGRSEVSAELQGELDGIVKMMNNQPSLLLRVVGNLDFDVDPLDAEYVGVDRAREVRDYIRAKGVHSFRVFTAPLPRDYAFDKRVQIVFYISK